MPCLQLVLRQPARYAAATAAVWSQPCRRDCGHAAAIMANHGHPSLALTLSPPTKARFCPPPAPSAPLPSRGGSGVDASGCRAETMAGVGCRGLGWRAKTAGHGFARRPRRAFKGHGFAATVNVGTRGGVCPFCESERRLVTDSPVDVDETGIQRSRIRPSFEWRLWPSKVTDSPSPLLNARLVEAEIVQGEPFAGVERRRGRGPAPARG